MLNKKKVGQPFPNLLKKLVNKNNNNKHNNLKIFIKAQNKTNKILKVIFLIKINRKLSFYNNKIEKGQY